MAMNSRKHSCLYYVWLFRQGALKSIPRQSKTTLAGIADVYCIIVYFTVHQIISRESLVKCLGDMLPLNAANDNIYYMENVTVALRLFRKCYHQEQIQVFRRKGDGPRYTGCTCRIASKNKCCL